MTSRYSSMPSTPYSRPFPDCLKPPNGAMRIPRRVVEMHLTGADPRRDVLDDVHIFALHMRPEAIDGVVGDGDGLLHRLVRDDAKDRAEDLLLGDAHVRAHLGKDRRFDVEPGIQTARTARSAGDELRAFRNADADHGLDPVELGTVGDCPVGGGLRREGRRRRSHPRPAWRSNSISESSARGTIIRVGALHDWPRLRKAAAMPRETARSRSASGRITFGDLPPSSCATRLTVGAAAWATAMPARVEPVNRDHVDIRDGTRDPHRRLGRHH